jgi:hypothetical protein
MKLGGIARRFCAAVLLVQLGACANTLTYFGDKQRLGPPDLFAMLDVSDASAAAEEPATRAEAARRAAAFEARVSSFTDTSTTSFANYNAFWNASEPGKSVAIRQNGANCDARSDNFLSALTADPARAAKLRVCQTLTVFAEAVETSLNAKSSVDNSRAMFRAGANASDALCTTWFSQLDGARRASTQFRDVVSGLRALTTTIQGFTSVEPAAIGITSATMSQVVLGFESTEKNYLLPSDLAIINNSLRAYRERAFLDYLAGATGGTPNIHDYYSAERYLRAYHDLCSSNGIEFFILNSVRRGGENTPTPVEEAASQLSNVYGEQLRLQLSSILDVDPPGLRSEALTAISAYIVSAPAFLEAGTIDDKGIQAFKEKYLQAEVVSNLQRKSLGNLLDGLSQSDKEKAADALRNSPSGPDIIKAGEALLSEFKPESQPEPEPAPGPETPPQANTPGAPAPNDPLEGSSPEPN